MGQKIIKLTESDLEKIVRKVILEQKMTKDLLPGQSKSCSTSTQKADPSCYEGMKVRFSKKDFMKYMIPTIYKVKTGDTLPGLAKKFGIDVTTLMKDNMYTSEKDLKVNDIILFEGFRPGD